MSKAAVSMLLTLEKTAEVELAQANTNGALMKPMGKENLTTADALEVADLKQSAFRQPIEKTGHLHSTSIG